MFSSIISRHLFVFQLSKSFRSYKMVVKGKVRKVSNGKVELLYEKKDMAYQQAISFFFILTQSAFT